MRMLFIRLSTHTVTARPASPAVAQVTGVAPAPPLVGAFWVVGAFRGCISVYGGRCVSTGFVGEFGVLNSLM